MIPHDYDKAPERIADGEYFFSDEVPKFASGELPRKTQKDHPFFIPVILDCPDAPVKTVKFAFMERMGERDEMSGDRAAYPKFEEEIEDMFIHYNDRGISLIYVAPVFSPLAEFQFPDADRARKFDEALKGRIDE